MGIKKDELVPQEHIKELNKRLSSQKGIKVIWMQLGVLNVNAAKKAEKAGLKVGDIIFSVNDRNINTLEDILQVINEGLYKTGDFITLQIFRNSKIINIDIELEKNNQNEVD